MCYLTLSRNSLLHKGKTMIINIPLKIKIPVHPNTWKKQVQRSLIVIFAVTIVSGHLMASDKDKALELARSIEKNYKLNKPRDVGGTLEEYLAYAALNNPDLEAAFYKWKAQLEKIPQVSSLPDPIFSYGYFIENVETRVGPQNQKFSLKQMFPWFGTLGTKSDIAFEEANAAYESYQSKKLNLFFNVKSAYYDYYYLGREIEITSANMQLLKYWESVVRTKYQAAIKQYHDVIKAQVELGKLEDRLITMGKMKVPIVARLKAVLNLPDSIELPVPENLNIPEVRVDTDTVKMDIIANNPDLKVVAHHIEKEKASVNLAKKASYPNFTVGFDYIETGEAIDPFMDASGKDPWMANISINIPIWLGKNKAKRNQARANLKMMANKFENTKNELLATTEKVLFEYQDAERKINLYRNGLIPKTEQLLNATYTAYQAGDTDFLNVIDAQRQLVNFQLKLELALINKAKKLAEIEMLTGKKR